MISIVVTIGDMPPEHREPVLEAMCATLGNRAVDAVHVLTEDNVGWLPEAMGPLAARLHVEQVARRPTFGALIEIGNRLFAEGAGMVAIMNADIGFADPEDARRLRYAFDALSDLPDPVAFAVSRHEDTGAKPLIELYEASGLPNYISADAWVFQAPVRLTRELFYCPGQMNSDMLLGHDLITSGYRVLNPCLDVIFLHHKPAKDSDFYKKKNQEVEGQELLQRHIAQNKIAPFDYYRIPWISTEWVIRGYRPHPQHTHSRAIIMLADMDRKACTDADIAWLQEMSQREGRDCQIVIEGDADDVCEFFAAHATAMSAAPGVSVSPSQQPASAVRAACLAGQKSNFNSIAFVHSPAGVVPEILVEADCIMLSAGTGNHTPPAPYSPGCTLVTSVFRSDEFLPCFIANSVALSGYGDFIDHIFLVADMSKLERRLLNELLEEQPNVMVFWNREDPGLYNCWNLGIRMARRRYVSNANVDDLRDPLHVRTLIADLERHPDVLVAATALNPFHDFPTDCQLPEDKAGWYSDRAGRFTLFDLGHLFKAEDGRPRLEPHNMPHCMPVWRRRLHQTHGWFDEERYGTFADWAFWMKVLRGGGSGWINPAPLGYYFVNPGSHNRRGTQLEYWHGLVEEDFLPAFLARSEKRVPDGGGVPTVPRKLCLTGRDLSYGNHRNSFNRLIHALEPLARQDGEGVLFVPFLERYFVWGDHPGEAQSPNPEPLTRDWIGILHVPFDAPEWFHRNVSPETFFDTELWRTSRPACRGIITLAADLEADLRAYDPEIPVLTVRHPIEMNAKLFDPGTYRARPRVVQVGDWLRKLQAIHRLRAQDHERVMLLKDHTSAFLEAEIAAFGDARDPEVAMPKLVPNDEYDDLLSSSVVMCLLYATAANNVVLECIARATPILINPLPAVVEYLGHGYPLYACNERQAELLLAAPGKIEEAHRYLLGRRAEIDLSYAGFCRDIGVSEWYAAL